MINKITFLGFLVIILFSCASKRNADIVDSIDELPPEIISGNTSAYLYFKDKSDSVASRIDYDYYTNIDAPYKDSINGIIKRFVADNTGFSNDHIVDSRISNLFFQSELQKFKNVYDKVIEEEEYSPGIWTVEITVSINESHNDFVDLTTATWSYTGGAHGNGFVKNKLVDKKSGQLLSLKDFFSDVDALSKIGEPFFRKAIGITSDEDLNDLGFWFDDGLFVVNNNFKFSNGFISFCYNPYEIAPYAAGTIEFSIPIDDIKHLLKRLVD